jgi:hypothetical protein
MDVIMAVKQKLENKDRVAACAWWYTSVRQEGLT